MTRRKTGKFDDQVDAFQVEVYTLERKAEFLLSNAVGIEDYESAVSEVRRMGLDPEKVSHVKPARRAD